MSDIIQKLIKNIHLELDDEFDQNFERKAFFTEKWKETRTPRSNGSLLARTGELRKSIQSEITEDSIIWSSALPYASIHNSGGKIKVTAKMKKYFWAMYYKYAGSVSRSYTRQDGSSILFISSESKERMQKQANSRSKANKQLNKIAEGWKLLALKPIGSELLIPKRQFIGNHPVVNNTIQEIFEESKEDLEGYLNQQFGI